MVHKRNLKEEKEAMEKERINQAKLLMSFQEKYLIEKARDKDDVQVSRDYKRLQWRSGVFVR